MPNNLQALEALKQSANKQEQELQNTIKEIHTRSLQELNKSLQNTYNTSMKSLENAIQNRLEKSVQNSIKTKNWIIIALTAIVSMSIAIPSTWFLKPKEVVVQTQTQTQYKEVENTNLAQENKSLQAQNETYQNKIKQLQAENKSLKEWSILESNQGSTKDNRKWMKTSEVSQIEGTNKYWALIEKK